MTEEEQPVTPHHITFVTSFFQIYDPNNAPPNNRTNEWRIQQFEKIAETGICICVFVSTEFYDVLLQTSDKYPNVKIMSPISLEETIIYKLTKTNNDIEIELPPNRSVQKDTDLYMMTMHAKIELVWRIQQENPFNTPCFAWIDFSIAYIFKDIKKSQQYLQKLSICDLFRSLSSGTIAIPGCNHWREHNISRILDSILWRFCGGFFIGDAEAISEFWELYQIWYPIFLKEHKRLVWEVNFWAWMETKVPQWKVKWYNADHNDTILYVPYVKCLEWVSSTIMIMSATKIKKTVYPYPHVQDYLPMSASYLHLLKNS